ncbi:MAG: hypothetical protein ACK5MR_00070 [Cumulibacter sp.]
MLSGDLGAADSGESVTAAVRAFRDGDATGVHQDVVMLAQQDHVFDVGVATE